MVDAPTSDSASTGQPYRVLARKYRPSDFSSLIGQQAMVQTLSNAIVSGRLAHAFILTGVRGVGKTTTARIIARALNCVGPDGNGEATTDPCGVCDNCVAIAEDRHVDVMEMDAASRTGVEDIRELIDGVLYRPVSARYKIYIIDEVHMLSRNAFNALLKTLEEPPEHVKFIFATTEIRRVPVTVLSRCQRFDLRRVKFDVLVDHFASIADSEGANISRGAIGLIARASDGSVRDGLSLLDQAIAHSGPDTEIGEGAVRDMLGVAEQLQIFDLFEQLMRGEIADALERFDSMYHAGADPAAILQDLAELTHWLTRLKAAPETAEATPTSDLDLGRGKDLSMRLPMAVLAQTWQMLLKGISEVRTAHSAAKAAEMVLVRIAYASDLPTPADAVAMAGGNSGAVLGPKTSPVPVSSSGASPAGEAISAPAPVPTTSETKPAETPTASGGSTALAVTAMPQPSDVDDRPADQELPQNFEALVAMFAAKGEPLLHAYLVNNVHLVKFETGKISMRVSEGPPRDFTQNLSRSLKEWTGRAWFIESSQEAGAATVQQQRDAAAVERFEEAVAHPLVQKALEAFPGAEVTAVRSAADRAPEPVESAPTEPVPPDYLSFDFDGDEFDPDRFDPDNTDEDFI